MKKILLFIGSLIAVAGAADSPNLLKNGSFEEGLDAKGAPKFWRIEKNRGVEGRVEVVPDHATCGKFAAHLVKSNRKGSIYLIQNVRLKPNTDYELRLTGFRTAAHRWHYYGIRCPDSKVRAEGKIPADGGPCPPLRFTSDSKRTLCYVNLGLWGYNDNQSATVGEMWIDNVVLRELPREAGRWSDLPVYAFTSDRLRGELFVSSFRGKLTLTLTGSDGKIAAQKVIDVVPGNTAFDFSFAGAPVGTAKFTAVSADGTLKLSHPLTVQKSY